MSEEIKLKSKWSWKWRFYFGLTKLVIVLAGSLALSQLLKQGYSYAHENAEKLHEWVVNRLTITKYVREYRHADEATLNEIVAQVSKEAGIDPLILQVIMDKESSGGVALYRFEPEQFQRRAVEDRKLGLSEDERRMENSSHGPFHVMGYTARSECGLTWSELYNPWTSARCAALIVAKRWNALASIKNSGDRLREVFRAFNGSGPAADRYADDAMNRVAKILYQGIGKSTRS